ncbi:MAG TPA: hypothetical protein P5137_04345 [Candidatus Brocadiia bacterium]|nr:hypothetical protein [Candidatus Brocadiia bacterium]
MTRNQHVVVSLVVIFGTWLGLSLLAFSLLGCAAGPSARGGRAGWEHEKTTKPDGSVTERSRSEAVGPEITGDLKNLTLPPVQAGPAPSPAPAPAAVPSTPPPVPTPAASVGQTFVSWFQEQTGGRSALALGIIGGLLAAAGFVLFGRLGWPTSAGMIVGGLVIAAAGQVFEAYPWAPLVGLAVLFLGLCAGLWTARHTLARIVMGIEDTDPVIGRAAKANVKQREDLVTKAEVALLKRNLRKRGILPGKA